MNGNIDSVEFSKVVRKLRKFFEHKGFVEVHTQNRLSILAACEDPDTMTTYKYSNEVWPLPQTGQMWLEYELLKNPELPCLFCVSTSYRNEPNPVPGRHELIFPMFEFEMKGDMQDLLKMEKELMQYLGFKTNNDDYNYPEEDYENVAKKYNVSELENEHEERLEKENGSVFFLKHFPMRTSPFWNMKINDEDKDLSEKIDVIVHGIETIGSAERSSDKEQMRNMFNTISNGEYSNTLYKHFTKERVVNELDEFLKFNFFKRSGGGIGMTRMIRAIKMSNLLDYEGSLDHVTV